MSDGFHPHTILIATGSLPRAEQLDRPLAYYLKGLIDKRAGRDPRRQALVISDLWYLQNESIHDQPIISVGGPGLNAVSAAFYRGLPAAMVVENVLLIQMDVEFNDLRAAVWGMDHDGTKTAVATFAQDRFLGKYLEAVWARSPSES